jgi:glutaredoxin
MWHHHAAISVPPEQLPSPVENPNLNYSPRFRSAAGRQTVTLEVVVSQNGKLKEVIEIKDEPEPELAQYAKELVAQIQFPQLAPADRSVTDNRISLEVRLAPL